MVDVYDGSDITWEVIPLDRRIEDREFQPPEPSSERVTHPRALRWFSTVLIVVGLLLVGAGGLKAYWDVVYVPEPPPPVGLVESSGPPSLEDNPLPVVVGSGQVQTALPDATVLAIGTEAASPTVLAQGVPPGGEQVKPTQATPGAKAADLMDKLGPGLPASAPATMQSQADLSPADSDVLRRPVAQVAPVATLTPVPALIPVATHSPTRIVAPAINLDGPVVPVGWKQVTQNGQSTSVWEVAEYAAGWHKGSALPGMEGNVVLSGHHNIKGEIFRYVVDLNPGDTITLYADDHPYTYTVESRFVLRDKGVSEQQRQENARWIGAFPDARLTLVTCWPYTNNTHRVIVIAKPAW
jgi:LPXTG-site transpeptidase (sortase) family protein